MNAERPHDRPDQRSVHAVRLYALAGMLISPLAWLLQMGLTEALAAQSCFPHDHPLREPALPRLVAAIVAVDLVCLVLGCLGGYLGWRNFLQLRRDRASDRSRGKTAELDWNLAYVGALSSALFLFALVTTDIAVLIVSPCSGW